MILDMKARRNLAGVAAVFGFGLVAACAQHNNIGTQASSTGGAKADAAGGAAGTVPGTGGVLTPTAGAGGANAAGGTSGAAGTSGLGGAAGASALPASDVGPPFFLSCGGWQPYAKGFPPPEIHLAGTDGVIRYDQHDCTFVASTPATLPLTAEDPSTLAFQLDMNDDGVDDLFFADNSASYPGPRDAKLVRLESLLQKVPGTQVWNLTYTRSFCSDFGPAFPSRALFLRDLNRDGVLDFVIGTGTTIDAYVNVDSGPPRGVLHHDFPNPGGAWAALLDVVVGDVDGDGTDDVTVGYDANTGIGGPNIVMGAMMFRGRPGTGTYEPGQDLASTTLGMALNGSESGYIAGVPAASGGISIFGLTWNTPGNVGWLYHGTTSQDVPGTAIPPDGAGFAQYTIINGAPTLFVGGPSSYALYDLTTTPATLRGTSPAAFQHDHDRELGGGPRYRTYYLLDIDGDGDDDLVEYETTDGPKLAISTQVAGVFRAPSISSVPETARSPVESPFAASGPMRGRLFVGDGARTVRMLNCAP